VSVRSCEVAPALSAASVPPARSVPTVPVYEPAGWNCAKVRSGLVAMTLSRLTVDRVVRHLGPVWVLRGGTLLATSAILTPRSRQALRRRPPGECYARGDNRRGLCQAVNQSRVVEPARGGDERRVWH
jgi:hypothetical protein